MAINLLIADDDPLIREGLRIILDLDQDFNVLGCVENGQAAVEFCRSHPVDVVLLDVQMPVLNGVEATRLICLETGTKPLILTTFDDDAFITQAIRYGAQGYILKNNPPDKIKAAIKMVQSGNPVLQGVVLDKLKAGLSHDQSGKVDRSLFSEREIEVIELIAKGRTNKEISRELYISEGTVKNYITAILTKTDLEHRTQIAIYWLNGGKF